MNRYNTNFIDNEGTYLLWEAIWIAAYEADVRKTRKLLKTKKLPEQKLIELKKKIIQEASNWSF